MENNCAKVSTYDAIVVGGGFKGMMTAFGLLKSGKSVAIVESANELGGFMSPIKYKGAALDKGPQFLDGMSQAQKRLLDDIMPPDAPLTELEFSYASYWNNQTTKNFAIPDYRTLAEPAKAMLLYETLNQSVLIEQPNKGGALADEFAEHSVGYITQWCKKFLLQGAQGLSALNRNFITFYGRKLLLDEALSVRLKQLPELDNLLAAEKKFIAHDTFNLYPKGQSMGAFKEAFNHKLKALGVKCWLNSECAAITKQHNGYLCTIKTAQSSMQLYTEKVYLTATIESSQQLLLGKNTIASFIKPVSQVFYYVELAQHLALPFYTMNYSADSIARVTYFSDFASDTQNHKPVLCIEVPTPVGSAIWLNPEQHFETVQHELREMGITGATEFKAFKIPSTYRALRLGYEQELERLFKQVQDKYGNELVIINPNLLTRSSIMHDLHEIGVLDY